MKKLLVIVASLLVAVSAHAQLGVVAGITSSKSDLKSAIGDLQGKNITQYHVGLTYKLDLGLIAIQPSILYNMKGTSFDYTNIASTQLDFKTGYLEVPVQLQAGVDLGIARVYGFVEPFVGYAISNAGSLNGTAIKDLNWENVKSRLEYGVGLGAGVELIKHVQVAVKYFWNMGDLYGGDVTISGASATIANSKASGIAASVALLF
ncbi:MAG: PorT family protein [Bacteroidales bacterium]|nr:PorT family protein [Bacteroidales bacterium]